MQYINLYRSTQNCTRDMYVFNLYVFNIGIKNFVLYRCTRCAISTLITSKNPHVHTPTIISLTQITSYTQKKNNFHYFTSVSNISDNNGTYCNYHHCPSPSPPQLHCSTMISTPSKPLPTKPNFCRDG